MMNRLKMRLCDQRGNMTIFTLTIFMFFFFVFFVALFNFSSVFVDKEKAANSAQLASLAATRDVYEQMEIAINNYDQAIATMLDPVFLNPIVQSTAATLRATHPHWAESEVQFEAIDEVLADWLPGNGLLQGFVLQGLIVAETKASGAVSYVLSQNGATLSGSTVRMFTGDHRIEVETSVRFQSESMGFDFLPAFSEKIYQKGQSRQIRFIGAVSGWQSHSISF